LYSSYTSLNAIEIENSRDENYAFDVIIGY